MRNLTVPGAVFSLLIVLLTTFPSVSFAWNLTHLAFYDPPNYELLDIEISGNYAYVPGGLFGSSIIDISDPSSPVSVGIYWVGRQYAWCVQGDYAYGSARYEGINVVDVSSPSDPTHITTYGTSGKSYEHADGNGLYLFAATHTDGIEIIDISTPQSPQFVSSVPTENAWAVDEYGGLVYIADGAGGLKIIDVSNPQQPQLLGEAGASGTAKDVTVEGSYAFVAVGANGVDMFDISDPFQPILVANYKTTGYASRVTVSDSLVAVSDWDDVEILKWNDSPSLSLAGYKKTGGRVMAINMVDDIVFSAEWHLFRTFQFGPIEEPDLDLSLHTIDFPYAEIDTCLDTILYLTNNGQTLLTLQDTTIDHPDFTFYLPTTIIAPGEQVEGTVTYCATPENAQATLSLESNDPDEALISIPLMGNFSGIEAGEVAPDFVLPSVNGFGDITLSDLQGKVVVIAFFVTW